MGMSRGRRERNSKELILETARRLFTARGYETTSVDAILLDCKLSKGTFYHFFNSKADLLNDVVDEMLQAALKMASPVLEDSVLGAAEKLDRFLAAGREWRLSHARTVAEVARVMLAEENALLREKLRRRSTDILLPFLARIINDGVAEGAFSIPHSDPAETAALVLHLADGVGDSNFRELLQPGGDSSRIARVKKRADACFTAIERILGARPGVLSRLDDDFLTAVARSLDGTGD